MALPLKPPVKPQLALSRKELPEGDEWAYEQKWDGFRAIAFVDGEDVHVQSRNGRPLSRYFPELVFHPGRYVLDGELVIVDPHGHEEFNALQQRIHPAASRIERLAAETPARFRVFDLLAANRRKLLGESFAARRDALEALVESWGGVQGSVELTELVRSAEEARPWLEEGEGVIAKRLDAPYRPGERKGMVKVKRMRTIDCVVVGWRPGKEEGTVGSLILGLYDDGGELHVVGHTSGFKAKEKRELRKKLAPYETGGRGSGDPSRWDAGRELEWVELRPELVIEITFDHTSCGRIRHGTKLLRWRDDRDPKSCLLSQLQS
jgi:ATP-dependent DNA ligase